MWTWKEGDPFCCLQKRGHEGTSRRGPRLIVCTRHENEQPLATPFLPLRIKTSSPLYLFLVLIRSFLGRHRHPSGPRVLGSDPWRGGMVPVLHRSSEATLRQGDTSFWPGSQESLSSDGGPFIFADSVPGHDVRRRVEVRTGWG